MSQAMYAVDAYIVLTDFSRVTLVWLDRTSRHILRGNCGGERTPRSLTSALPAEQGDSSGLGRRSSAQCYSKTPANENSSSRRPRASRDRWNRRGDGSPLAVRAKRGQRALREATGVRSLFNGAPAGYPDAVLRQPLLRSASVDSDEQMFYRGRRRALSPAASPRA